MEVGFAALAERYGYGNRALPDQDFQSFVDAYARRVSGWNHQALGEIKTFINKYTRLPDAEFPLHSDAFWGAVARPEFPEHCHPPIRQGTFQDRGPLEYRLGEDIAAIAQG
jgi:hypothetical protein